MEIKNTRSLTELIFTKLKERYDQLSWSLYPPIQNLEALSPRVSNLNLSSFEITRKYSDGRLSAEIHFTLNLLFKDVDLAEFNIRDAAFSISAFLHRNNFNHDQIGETEIISNEPDYLQPDIDGYLSWKIEFLVPFACGESVYEANGEAPDVEIDSSINHD
ncbi:hypothetical protein L3V83_12535 [Thiotrichales bacterium 19X7-9]|nr:hypothetical protein [Thiotrichales bacterium 19X7-9]